MEQKKFNYKEALFYDKLPNKKVRCLLCPRNCFIQNNSTGFCRVRKNLDGKLYSLVYSRPCTISIDPIEKKPLFHFFPGTQALSIATCGCNLTCTFCQNYEISQGEIFGEFLSPEKVVELAKKHKVKTIAYTYTEPTVFYEYCLDIMKLAKIENLKNVFISNGYINKDPIKKIAPYLDAVNIDIKGEEQVYSTLSHASLKPILKSILEFKKTKTWIELTSLIIPGYNDSKEWIDYLSNWIKNNLGSETPLHLSRFHPAYKLTNLEPTKISVLKELHKEAKKKLKYVYHGNVFDQEYESTYCKKCGDLVIKRHGYEIDFKSSKCRKCGTEIAGVFT